LNYEAVRSLLYLYIHTSYTLRIHMCIVKQNRRKEKQTERDKRERRRDAVIHSEGAGLPLPLLPQARIVTTGDMREEVVLGD
jgi:hypothetical protein